MEKFGMLVGKKRKLIVFIAILLFIPSVIGFLMVPINYDILAYLPSDVESVKGQAILSESFKSSNQGYLVFEDTPEYIIDDKISKIKEVPGVQNVLWIRDMLNMGVPKEILPEELSEIIYRDDCVLVLINFEGNATDESTQNAIADIREISGDHSFLSGMGALIKDTIDISNTEKIVYMALAVVLTIIVLALTLKSTIIPILFLLSIGFSIAVNLGTNIFLKDISYVTEAIAAVLQLGVTMDFSIFLYHRYEEERANYADHIEAMGVAVNKTAVSISGAALTTIAGFLALCAMKLTIGSNIGIVMAKGVLIGVISTLTLTPALILIFDRAIHRFQHPVLMPSFEKLSRFVVKRHVLLLVLGLLLLIPAIYGASNTNVYYKLDESLPQDLESIVSLNKMKATYDMATTHMIIFKDDLPDYQIDEMVGKIEALDGVSKVIAYNKLIGPMIPVEMVPAELSDVFYKNGYEQIIVNSSMAVASDETSRQLEAIRSIIRTYDPEALITGEGALSQDLIEISDIDFKNVNILSIIAVFVIIMISFKSLSIPVLLISVIELAVSINMGIPYYTGATIPFIATIVIGTIQLGSTVDYAILLTTRFKEELEVQNDKFEAMTVALKSASKSIMTSGLTFFVTTVSVAFISKIDLISSLSGMIGRGALISMVTIMLILPSVLLIFEGVIQKTTMKWRKI